MLKPRLKQRPAQPPPSCQAQTRRLFRGGRGPSRGALPVSKPPPGNPYKPAKPQKGGSLEQKPVAAPATAAKARAGQAATAKAKAAEAPAAKLQAAQAKAAKATASEVPLQAAAVSANAVRADAQVPAAAISYTRAAVEVLKPDKPQPGIYDMRADEGKARSQDQPASEAEHEANAAGVQHRAANDAADAVRAKAGEPAAVESDTIAAEARAAEAITQAQSLSQPQSQSQAQPQPQAQAQAQHEDKGQAQGEAKAAQAEAVLAKAAEPEAAQRVSAKVSAAHAAATQPIAAKAAAGKAAELPLQPAADSADTVRAEAQAPGAAISDARAAVEAPRLDKSSSSDTQGTSKATPEDQAARMSQHEAKGRTGKAEAGEVQQKAADDAAITIRADASAPAAAEAGATAEPEAQAAAAGLKAAEATAHAPHPQAHLQAQSQPQVQAQAQATQAQLQAKATAARDTAYKAESADKQQRHDENTFVASQANRYDTTLLHSKSDYAAIRCPHIASGIIAVLSRLPLCLYIYYVCHYIVLCYY